MDRTEDRRRLTRLPFTVEIRLQAGGLTLAATSRNICMTGVLASASEVLPVQTECSVEIVLSAGLESASIRGRGVVVRHMEDVESGRMGMGIRLVELEDGSQERLWHVIRYNTPPTDQGCDEETA